MFVLQLSKFHWFLAFVALMVLRVAVGYHFFKEGSAKIQDGFTAEYFLAAAKGPLAPYFHSMLDDPSGRQKLCVVDRNAPSNTETIEQQDRQPAVEMEPDFDTDSTLTFAIWNDFIDRASHYYEFGPDQIKEADVILATHEDELTYWLDANRTELISHFATANRLVGFDRDGSQRDKVAIEVASLRGQVDTIRTDRTKKIKGWSGEVTAIWDSLENQINSIALQAPAKNTPVAAKRLAKNNPYPIHRPFAQKYSKLQVIDKFIPWFDLVVGVLLILGLFTRFASLMGAGFLASVIATQPPWIPGTTPTYYQAIEMFALLVIFATCAGRLGGLDFFLFNRRSNKNNNHENTAVQND